MINALTVDVEDYYNIFSRDWLGIDLPPTQAVVANTRRIIELLAERDTRATFFFLGEVAREYPSLVKGVVAAGHELGVHGMNHSQVFKLSRDDFARDTSEAKRIIEDCAGCEAPGYRAPAFSICPDTAWALEVIADLGFRYDSSIFPISGRRYGWPGFRRDIHEAALPGGRRIIEAPACTVGLLGLSLPACGGGYLRHFPYWVTRLAMRRVQRCRPAVVYMHPYEIDAWQPPADFAALLARADGRTRRFHRMQVRNRDTVVWKLSRLLGEFGFAPLGQVIDRTLGARTGYLKG